MFYNGSKVIVIKSNVIRKSGPRLGSIGYVTYVDKRVHKVTDEFHFQIVGVLFSRYGYEKQHRSELKFIKSIIPAKINSNANPKRFVNSLAHNLVDLNSKGRDLALLAPVNVNCNLTVLDEHKEEIFAFILSSLCSASLLSIFKMIVFEDNEIQKIRGALSSNLRFFLRKIIDNKLLEKKYNILQELFQKTEVAKELILLIHSLNSKIIFNKELHDRGRTALSSEVPLSFILNLMYKNMFKYTTYNKLKIEAINLGKDIKIIESIKQELISKGSQFYINS